MKPDRKPQGAAVVTLKGEIVKAALEKFPTTPTLTLAKAIYKENKELYKDPEHVRGIIRAYRGQRGIKILESLKDRRFLTEPGQYAPQNRLPEPIKYIDHFTAYPITSEKTLIISDLQLPFYQLDATMIALEAGRKHGVDGIFINGDLIDFFAISRFETNPKHRDLTREIDSCIEFLSVLREMFPKVKIMWKFGNHEERWESYMIHKCPELLDLPFTSLENIFETDQLGIEVIKDRRVAKIGDLNILHGHEFGKSIMEPVNPARTLYLKTKEHCMIGDVHKKSEHTEPSIISKSVVSCWSVGCLCDLHPRFLPYNKWTHGFALVDRLDEKKFLVRNRQIINGNIY